MPVQSLLNFGKTLECMVSQEPFLSTINMYATDQKFTLYRGRKSQILFMVVSTHLTRLTPRLTIPMIRR